MRTSKRLLKLLGLGLLGLSVLTLPMALLHPTKAHAQFVSPGTFGANDTVSTLTFGVTNVLTAGSSNSLGNLNIGGVVTPEPGTCGSPVDISGYDKVGVLISATNATATPVTGSFGICRVPDGIHYETPFTYQFSFTVPANTNLLWYTNLDQYAVGSANSLAVVGMTNTTASAASQFGIFVVTKVLRAPR